MSNALYKISLEATRKPPVKTVRITVFGGVVQDVRVPKGIRVIVKDYDVEGCTSGLDKDGNGDQYMRSVYEK